MQPSNTLEAQRLSNRSSETRLTERESGNADGRSEDTASLEPAGNAAGARQPNGIGILPIPPPLEFPYPTAQNRRASYGFPNRLEKSQSKGDDVVGRPTKTPLSPATPGLLKKSSEPANRPGGPRRRFLTERPPNFQRRSIMGIRRRQTAEPPDIYNPALFESESESEQSDSSEEGPFPSQTLNKSKSAPPKGSKSKTQHLAGRRPSDDPYSKFSVGNEGYRTRGRVSKRDGRLNISLQEIGNHGYLAKALGATLKHRFGEDKEGQVEPLSPYGEPQVGDRTLSGSTVTSTPQDVVRENLPRLPFPKMNVVIMVIGSRGDIQPFLRLGKVLKEDYGHRVRIATHPAFREFIEKDSDLEFFSVGGDPAELMAFMVKNPGLIPKRETIRSGEIGRRREAMYEMFKGFWRACINTTDDETDVKNLRLMGQEHPFVADAIIANPPSFAHIHCAERLGIPLHLMFTFPTSPTQQFPHPLANIKKSNIEANYTNFMSYPLVDMMTWQGLGDLVNRFRVKSLGLEPISTLWAPGQLFRLRVPYTYLWSPDLIPKPSDWGPEIKICGFLFLDLASSFEPPDDLSKFLNDGPPPVYIGFGSIVVDDPEKFTELIFEAVNKAGVRALVSKGWGGLGDEDNTPDNIFMLGNTPHDWLFPRVSAVVHHGGAGTTAIGMKCGKPTMIVPFFGDQPFWGAMVAKAGAGSDPIPYKRLTADKLAAGIRKLLEPETQEAAQTMAKKIEQEGDGAKNAIQSFHQSLPTTGNHSIRCSILQERVATWWLKSTHMRLSSLAAEMLVRQGKTQWKDLRLIRHYEWNDFEGPGEPFTGAGAAIASSFSDAIQGIGGTPFKWMKTLKGEGKQKEKRRNERVANGIQEKEKSEAERSKSDENPVNHEECKNASINSAKRGTSPLRGGTYEANLAQDLAHDTGSGLAKTGAAIAKAPMDISLAVVRGFHNAPRLYGDSTVRTPRRVQGIKSGFLAGSEEARFGIYDGWSGLVKQPYHGAKEGGAFGLVKGIGKGVGGWVLKDIAAVCGIPAYTMKGIHEEIFKSRQPTKFIRRARIFQGQRELKQLSKEDMSEIDGRIREAWKVVGAMEKEIEMAKSKGIIQGRIQIHRGKRKWKKYGIFESTEQTRRALEAHRAGRDLDEEFIPQQHANKEHNSPRDYLVDKDKVEKKKASLEKARADQS